jgi:hypothetical protein
MAACISTTAGITLVNELSGINPYPSVCLRLQLTSYGRLLLQVFTVSAPAYNISLCIPSPSSINACVTLLDWYIHYYM